MIERHRARMLALQALFEADVGHHEARQALARLLNTEKTQADTAAFAEDLVQGVLAHRAEIDARVQEVAPAFPVEQLAAIDRNVLRLALYELLYHPETPVRAVVNEAVELAKAYGSDGSRRFVNGVLGAISMSLTR
jgi:transcription antitermination protein NusB